MAEVIRMPKMSDTMEEGVIAEWHKKVGDVVKSGDILAEVETDKATMELESYEEGTLLYIGVEKGGGVPVDALIAIIGKPGEDFQSLLTGGKSAPAEAAAPAPAPVPVASPAAPSAPQAHIDATIIRMPKMSDTMEEGVLVSWQKQVGDTVKAGDILAEVETDKATMELEAYEDGTLLHIGISAGSSVPVNEVIAVIGKPGADFQALLARENGQVGSPVAEAAPAQVTSAPVAAVAEEVSEASSADRVKASPLAKKLAAEKGVDLSQVQGSGDNGRIVKRDVDSFVPASKPVAAPAPTKAVEAQSVQEGGYEDTPVSQMRKTISRRLSESKFTAPHFYLTMEINMDKAMALRPQLNEISPAKISFNDMVIKACALALKQHPAVNSAWLGDKIRKYNYVNIGVAVAVDEGLLVPVVRDADKKTLSVISSEVKEFAGKAKDKKLQPKDWEGNTFSISNLGMFGIDEFTAIINPPDACILAVGAIKQTAAFKEDGSVYPTNVMKVTLSCDHRVVDGASGSAFLQTVKKYLENPMGMLV